MAKKRVTTSLRILREDGPMTLRELTRRTAMALGYDQFYADVDAAMREHEKHGQATREEPPPAAPYADSVWTAK